MMLYDNFQTCLNKSFGKKKTINFFTEDILSNKVHNKNVYINFLK